MKQEKYESFFSLIRLGKQTLNHDHSSQSHPVNKDTKRTYIETQETQPVAQQSFSHS